LPSLCHSRGDRAFTARDQIDIRRLTLSRLRPDVVTKPPSLISSLAFLANASGLHQDRPAPVAHSCKTSIPSLFITGLTKQTRGSVQAASQFGTEFASNYDWSLCRESLSCYVGVTLTRLSVRCLKYLAGNLGSVTTRSGWRL